MCEHTNAVLAASELILSLPPCLPDCCQMVVHYQLPASADTYIHRSGRTARTGSNDGVALVSNACSAHSLRVSPTYLLQRASVLLGLAG
jgi:hypothetical protein